MSRPQRPTVTVQVPPYSPRANTAVDTPPPYSLCFIDFGMALENPNETPAQAEGRAVKCVARVLREYLLNEFVPILSHPVAGFQYHKLPKWRKSAPAYQQFRLFRSQKVDPVLEDIKALFMIDDSAKMSASLDKVIKSIYNVVDKALIAWRDEMLYESEYWLVFLIFLRGHPY